MNLTKNALSKMSQMFIDGNVAQSEMHSIQCGVRWAELEAAGFDITSEPYLRSMLMAKYRYCMHKTHSIGIMTFD